MQQMRLFSFMVIVVSLFASESICAQTTITIGTGTSSSSTRGPFQRSDIESTTVYSRFVHVYTAAELSAAGMPSGVSITQLNWELASSNVIIGAGDATLKIYIKNSAATEAAEGDWADQIGGSSLVVDNAYNTSNNFPGENGWMPFTFDAPFVYDGNAIEIAVDWDCSTVSTPAFSGDGSIKWRWDTTAPDFLVVKKTSSSAPSTNISDLRDERANIQMVYNESSCAAPSGLNASNITTTSADLSWAPTESAVSYNWKVVVAGAGSEGSAIDEGSTSSTDVSVSGLMELTSYDLFVEGECDDNETSGFSNAYSFLTLAESQLEATIGVGTSSSSTRGPLQRSDVESSTVFSRFVHVYTASELASAGILTGNQITALNWDLASENVIIGAGNANLKIYVRNSSATAAMTGDWVDLVGESALVFDNNYNTTNNFPGVQGWMSFPFSAPFVYDGGAIEIAVDWDCSQVATPAFSGDGSLKWRWDTTAPDFLVAKKTASSAPATTIDDLSDERANIQIVYTAGPVSTDNIDRLTKISIAPNPTSGISNLDLELTENADISVAVYSVRGELLEEVFQERVDRVRLPIDLSAYENGLYFLRVAIDEQVTSEKIIYIK